MKLSKIYSNKENFKTVVFNDSLNVIIGKVTKQYDRERDTHNLGKTTLVSIIDFMFLKDVDKDHIFVRHKNIFHDYIFFLEIKLNNGKYVTIKRGVENDTKISIKVHKEKHQNYVEADTWDFQDLPLNSKFPKNNPKYLLNKLLDFNILPDFDYRQTINYFLRIQRDYNEVFHLSKFAGKDINWKPFLFALLGFSQDCIIHKYQLHAQYDDQKKFIARVEKELSVSPDEVDKINGLIQIKEEERDELKRIVDDFDFYMREKSLQKELINDLESKTANLNSYVYSLDLEINKIQESLALGLQFDFNEVEQIFQEAKIYFSDQFKKDYNQLIVFNTKITEERNKYLRETLQNKEKELKDTSKTLEALNQKRKQTLAVLKEKDTFRKFKNYQADLTVLETEIERLRFQLQNIDIVKTAREKLKKFADDIQKVSIEIQKEVVNDNSTYTQIRKTFNSLMKKIIHQPGILSISINTNGNVDFKAEIANITNNEITSKDKGHTYKKIMCVCFDLALLMVYSKDSFYRFVYHDGSLESLDHRKKLEYLDLLKEVCDKYELQYILTLIEHDLPIAEDGHPYKFSKDQIALELDDSDNDKGRLFEMTF
jgi:uncharacterized protein YydD (DUF2326 family)